MESVDTNWHELTRIDKNWHEFDTLRHTGTVQKITRENPTPVEFCVNGPSPAQWVGVVSAIWNSTLCPKRSVFLSRESMSGMRFRRISRHSNVGIMGWMSGHGAGHTALMCPKKPIKVTFTVLPSIECSARKSNNNDRKRQRKLFRVHCRRRHRRLDRVKSKFYGEKNNKERSARNRYLCTTKCSEKKQRTNTKYGSLVAIRSNWFELIAEWIATYFMGCMAQRYQFDMKPNRFV